MTTHEETEVQRDPGRQVAELEFEARPPERGEELGSQEGGSTGPLHG